MPPWHGGRGATPGVPPTLPWWPYYSPVYRPGTPSRIHPAADLKVDVTAAAVLTPRRDGEEA